MSRVRLQLAFSLDGGRFSAVVAKPVGDARQGRRLRVIQCLDEPIPTEIKGDDPPALGRWIGRRLRETVGERAQLSPAVVGVPRGAVVLKRLAVPPGVFEHEHPEFVRLQMARAVTLTPDRTAIDFVPLPVWRIIPAATTPGAESGAGQSGRPSSAVLAAALGKDQLDFLAAVCAAAGLKLGRVGLLSSGAAALFAEEATRGNGGALGILLGRADAEYVVISEGHMVFARSAEFSTQSGPSAAEVGYEAQPSSQPPADPQQVAVEAKRTWMTFRASPDATTVERALLLAISPGANELVERCASALDMPCKVIELPEQIDTAEGVDLSVLSAAAPVLGLLIEPLLAGSTPAAAPALQPRSVGRAVMDFANPRRGPDRAAFRRRAGLLGSLAAILVFGGAFTFARIDLAGRRDRIAELRQRHDAQAADLAELLRTQARADHLHARAAARPDWQSIFRSVLAQPIADGVAFDALAGRAELRAEYAASGGEAVYRPESWRPEARATLVFSASAERPVLERWRGTLVADPRLTIQHRGAESPGRIDWSVTVDAPTPVKEETP